MIFLFSHFIMYASEIEVLSLHATNLKFRCIHDKV